MLVRPVGPWDRHHLSKLAPPDYPGSDLDVARFLAGQAFKWADDDEGCHARVGIDSDGTDRLVAVCAFERDLQRVDDYDWFIVGILVDAAFAGQHLGNTLLQTCLSEMHRQTPNGAACWHVHESNDRSRRLSERVGAVPDGDAEAGLLRYYVKFGEHPLVT